MGRFKATAEGNVPFTPEEEAEWDDFNTGYFEKSVQGITETITEVKPLNGESYWERKDDMEKFFDKTMEVENEHKKPH